MNSEPAKGLVPNSPLSRAENFRSRLLIGTTVILFSNLIFAGADLLLSGGTSLPVWACKGVQVIEILWVRYRLHRGARMPEMNFLGVLMVSTVIAMTSLSGYFSNEKETTQILSIAILFASAGIVPWPRGSQMIIALVAVGSIWALQMVLGESATYGILAVGSGAACSVLMADLLARRRVLVEKSEKVAHQREREQREITDILLSGSSSIVAGLGKGDLMTFFCEILATQLGCRWVLAIETRVGESGPVALPVAQFGLPEGDWASLDNVPMERSLDGLIEPNYRDEVAEVRVPQSAVIGGGHEDAELSLLLVRLRESDSGGVVLTAWRDAAVAPFGERERTIAQGMAPLLSASLEQRRLLAELEAAQAWQQNFLASLSHELRTPLNIILGYMEMLLDRDLPVSDDEARVLQEKVKWNASNQLRLVNEALELSRRDESGAVVIRREIVDLHALLSQSVEEANLQARSKNVVISGAFPAVLPKIRTDAVKLRIVLSNLLDNARKFTEQGSILLKVELRPETIIFFVQDTGRGIALEVLPELFRAFRQGERGDPGGLGLGLYIVRRLVQSLNGEVTVDSELGSGSTFAVEIPLLLVEDDSGG